MPIESHKVSPESAVAQRRAFVVVGMHRSGTSAMTRTLSLLGAALPKRLMPPVEGNNDAGFWEPQGVADLNDEILQAQDSDWDDVFSFRPRQYLSNFDRFYAGRATELLEQEFNGSEVIVLKDPRISVLTRFWDRALTDAGYAVHYVIMVRDPLEVAESLRARDGFPREKSLLLWSSYMVAAERDTRDRQRIFVSYDQLIDDWRSVRKRIQESAQVPFPRDTATAAIEIDRHLNRALRHHDLGADELSARSDVPEEVKALYQILREACAGAEIDRAAVDAIQAELAKMDELLGPVLADFRARERSLTRDLSALNDVHATLEQAQSGLRETVEMLERDLAAERDDRSKDAAEHDHELSDARSRLAAVEAERDRIGRDAEAETGRNGNEIAELIRRLAAEESARDSLQAMVDQARNDQHVAELALGSERTGSAAALNALKGAMQARLDERFTEIAELTQQLQDRQFALTEAREAYAQKEANLTAALEQLQIERNTIDSKLGERFKEIASLSAMLAEREALERRSREDLDWLREATAILLGGSRTLKGRLARLLPAALHFNRQRRSLKRRGLFDGEAYLAAHADVALDAADPLQHYLTHGLIEHRRRR